MMEPKLSAALCALLVLSLGSAGHASNPGEESDPSSPPGDSVPGPGPEPASHTQNNISDTNPTFSDTSNTTTDNQTFPGKAREENATDVTSASHKNESSTSQPPSQPPPVPSESHSSTPHTVSVTTALTTPSSNHSNTSNHSDTARPGTFSTTKQPTQTEAPSSTSTQTPEQQKPETSPTTTTTLPGSTSSTGSQPPTSTSESGRIPQTSTEAQLKTTTSASPGNTSIQARTHAGSPSQLNMGGDSAHGPPTLDPLLAGLVSAFILTAVIIALLLFLKFRRRNNRPEFRRLQDLPMDDMMEDTPLSMYSY